jgi:hypothetical protein
MIDKTMTGGAKQQKSKIWASASRASREICSTGEQSTGNGVPQPRRHRIRDEPRHRCRYRAIC